MKLFKQRKTTVLIGNLLQITSQMAIPMAGINMILQIIITTRLLAVPIWILAALIVSALLFMALLVWKLVMPSYFTSWNNQFYRHGNKLREDIETIQRHLGIEVDEKKD